MPPVQGPGRLCCAVVVAVPHYSCECVHVSQQHSAVVKGSLNADTLDQLLRFVFACLQMMPTEALVVVTGAGVAGASSAMMKVTPSLQTCTLVTYTQRYAGAYGLCVRAYGRAFLSDTAVLSGAVGLHTGSS